MQPTCVSRLWDGIFLDTGFLLVTRMDLSVIFASSVPGKLCHLKILESYINAGWSSFEQANVHYIQQLMFVLTSNTIISGMVCLLRWLVWIEKGIAAAISVEGCVSDNTGESIERVKDLGGLESVHIKLYTWFGTLLGENLKCHLLSFITALHLITTTRRSCRTLRLRLLCGVLCPYGKRGVSYI